jgi:hypothetical protein
LRASATNQKPGSANPTRPLKRKPLGEWMGDPEKSVRIADAMPKRQKIIVADRQEANDGEFGQFQP